jgi:hypothetical protein
MDIGLTIDRLKQMGYLKYVSPARADEVRAQLVESMQQGYLDSEWDEDLVSADRRSYPADSEELAEGNLGEVLNLLKPVLKIEGVSIKKIEDDFSEQGYRVIIDGIQHSIWNRTDSNGPNTWALATKRSLEIINGLLENARSPERLWGVYGGNDGRFYLLTAEMRRLLSDPSLNLNRKWLPYPSTDVRLSE